MKKDVSTGLLVGFLLAGPLVSSLYLFDIAEGTPFITFEFFDGLARILPETRHSRHRHDAARADVLGLELRSSSKTAEQIQAIAIFMGVCALASGMFFAKRKQERTTATTWTLRIVLGIAVAISMMVLEHLVGSTHEHSLLGAVWTTFALAVWGSCARFPIGPPFASAWQSSSTECERLPAWKSTFEEPASPKLYSPQLILTALAIYFSQCRQR